MTDESTPPDSPQITRSLPTRLANLRDRLIGEIAQLPGAACSRRSWCRKLPSTLRAQRRVRDLGMKLQAVDRQRRRA